MKDCIVCPRGWVSTISLLLCVALFNTGCMTTETYKLTIEEPMTEDTEARVMRETGISGAVTGALLGAIVAGGVTAGIVALSGGSAEQIAIAGGSAAAAGAIAGGAYGYQKGKEKGQQVVAKAMERDQLQKLIDGARAYNARLARVNSALRTRLSEIREIQDPKMRVKQYNQVLKIAKKEEADSSKRLQLREKAIDNPQWANSDKPAYKSTVTKLKQENSTLAGMIGQIEKAKQTAAL